MQYVRLKTCVIPALFAACYSTVYAGVIEEVVVTAQKREQQAQDIPVAVSALTGVQLEQLGISNVFDLQQSVPSLAVRQNQNATTSNFSIRGVGTSGSNFGLESSVGLYVDGVYRARQNSMINEMVDMASVEVLRGPQGTLFGRNTPSGAVLLNTRAPEHEFGGYMGATLGNFGQVSVNGAVGGSLVPDVLAWRLTGFTTDRDGYVSDLALGNDVINDRDREGGRLQFLVTPTDELSVRVIADYSQIDEHCCAAITVKNNYLVFPRDNLTGNFAMTPSAGTDTILSIPSAITIPGTPVPGFGATIIDESLQNNDLVSFNMLPQSSNEDSGLSVQLDWQVMGGEFTSISAWRQFDSSDLVDGDFISADIFSRNEEAEQEAFTQEFRFHYAGDTFDAIVGAYYFQQDLNTSSDTGLGADANNFVALSVYSQASTLADQALLAAQAGDLATAAALQRAAQYTALTATGMVLGLQNVPLPTDHPVYPLQALGFQGVAYPAGATGRNQMSQDHQASAIFGQIDYYLTPELTVTAGLRYTVEDKDITGTFSEPGSSWGALLGLDDLTVVNPRPGVDESLDDEQLTGTLKLSWRFNDDILWYLSYGTGYKSGGTNTDRIHPSFSTLFDAETSATLEAGVKADFPEQNLRVNLTLHNTTTKDYQTNAFQGNGFNLSNAGKVEAHGGELELWWNPQDSLSLTAAYTYNKAEFKGFERANCWISYSWLTGIPDPGRQMPTDQFCDRSGGPLDTNPEHTFIVGATKTFALSQGLEAYIHGDYFHVSKQYMDGNLDPFKLQDGYGILNARAGVRLLDSRLEVSLWSRNLLDEDYFNVYYDVPLQFGKLNAYPTEPRTYGLDMRFTF